MAIRNRLQLADDDSVGTTAGIKVSGLYLVGETLTLKVSGGVVLSSIQWVRLVDGVEVNIAGATSASYTLTLEDGSYKVYPKVLAYTLTDTNL
jgi:hypothetical protein